MASDAPPEITGRAPLVALMIRPAVKPAAITPTEMERMRRPDEKRGDETLMRWIERRPS